MTYYKVFDGAEFIGVGTSDDLRKHQKKHNILVFAGGAEAQYISVGDELYHDKWMKEPTADLFEWQNASVVAVDENEYKTLKDAMESEESITPNEEEFAEEDGLVDDTPECEDEEFTVEYVRDVKIRELNIACRSAITAGFDIEIGEETLHFSLTSQDQINLQDAAMQILAGSKDIPYHADGGEYRLFSASEMLAIVTEANNHKTHHLAYCNALKNWASALKRASSIRAIEYGSEIPTKYKTAFLKSLDRG